MENFRKNVILYFDYICMLLLIVQEMFKYLNNISILVLKLCLFDAEIKRNKPLLLTNY